MLEASRRVAMQDFGPTWLMAETQSAGRGRQGRAWASDPGNLYATLLMPFDGEPGAAALRSFSASLAVAEAIDAVTGAPARTTLKWPNDVLVDGRKISGILLEGGKGWLAIGIGVNLVTSPLEARWPPIALAEIARAPSPPEILVFIADAFSRFEASFSEHGFAAIRAAWLARAARLGEEIEARLPRETLTGRFDGIDADGALLLTQGSETARIAAADIHF